MNRLEAQIFEIVVEYVIFMGGCSLYFTICSIEDISTS